MAHKRTLERRDALALLPGQAVHLGHSCVLVDVAGLRLLLDPATLTGHATAPFANLTTTDCPLQTYRPLFDLPALIGSPRSLAQATDIVLFSHMHADAPAFDLLPLLQDKLHALGMAAAIQAPGAG